MIDILDIITLDGVNYYCLVNENNPRIYLFVRVRMKLI